MKKINSLLKLKLNTNSHLIIYDIIIQIITFNFHTHQIDLEQIHQHLLKVQFGMTLHIANNFFFVMIAIYTVFLYDYTMSKTYMPIVWFSNPLEHFKKCMYFFLVFSYCCSKAANLYLFMAWYTYGYLRHGMFSVQHLQWHEETVVSPYLSSLDIHTCCRVLDTTQFRTLSTCINDHDSILGHPYVRSVLTDCVTTKTL